MLKGQLDEAKGKIKDMEAELSQVLSSASVGLTYRFCIKGFFFFTLVTGPRRSLRLKLSDTRVNEPQIRGSKVDGFAPRNR